MAKERIYELAKELKMPSKDLVNMAIPCRLAILTKSLLRNEKCLAKT